MKDWPEGDGTLSFEELTAPVCSAIREVYTLKRRSPTAKQHEDIEWTGPAMPGWLAANCLTFDRRLTAEMLDYDEHDQGRPPLEVIVAIAVQLGMEQERRRQACAVDHIVIDAASALIHCRAEEAERTVNTPRTKSGQQGC